MFQDFIFCPVDVTDRCPTFIFGKINCLPGMDSIAIQPPSILYRLLIRSYPAEEMQNFRARAIGKKGPLWGAKKPTKAKQNKTKTIVLKKKVLNSRWHEYHKKIFVMIKVNGQHILKEIPT